MEGIRTEADTVKYVIVVPRGGKSKYVGMRYNPKDDYGYSVKLNGAMMFNTPEAAKRFMEKFGMDGKVGVVEKYARLVEVM